MTLGTPARNAAAVTSALPWWTTYNVKPIARDYGAVWMWHLARGKMWW
jgi:hypothetical protein